MKKKYLSIVLAILAGGNNPLAQGASARTERITLSKRAFSLLKDDPQFARYVSADLWLRCKKEFSIGGKSTVTLLPDPRKPEQFEQLRILVNKANKASRKKKARSAAPSVLPSSGPGGKRGNMDVVTPDPVGGVPISIELDSAYNDGVRAIEQAKGISIADARRIIAEEEEEREAKQAAATPGSNGDSVAPDRGFIKQFIFPKEIYQFAKKDPTFISRFKLGDFEKAFYSNGKSSILIKFDVRGPAAAAFSWLEMAIEDWRRDMAIAATNIEPIELTKKAFLLLKNDSRFAEHVGLQDLREIAKQFSDDEVKIVTIYAPPNDPRADNFEQLRALIAQAKTNVPPTAMSALPMESKLPEAPKAVVNSAAHKLELLKSKLSNNQDALLPEEWQELRSAEERRQSGEHGDFKIILSEGQRKKLYHHFPGLAPAEKPKPAKVSKPAAIPAAQQPKQHRPASSGKAKSHRNEQAAVGTQPRKQQAQFNRGHQLPANPAAVLKDPRNARIRGETHGSDFAQATAVAKAPAPDAPTTNLVAERKADSPRPERIDEVVDHPKQLLLRDKYILLDDKLFNGWSNRRKGKFSDGHHKGPQAKKKLEAEGVVFANRELTKPGDAANGCYWVGASSYFPARLTPEDVRKIILSGCTDYNQHFHTNLQERITDGGQTEQRYVFKVPVYLPSANLLDQKASTVIMQCVVDVTDMDRKVIISACPTDF